jgi:hypothetical protein
MRDVLPNRRIRDVRAAAVLERRAIPREVWFEEGDCIALGQYRRMVLPDEMAPPGDCVEN